MNTEVIIHIGFYVENVTQLYEIYKKYTDPNVDKADFNVNDFRTKNYFDVKKYDYEGKEFIKKWIHLVKKEEQELVGGIILSCSERETFPIIERLMDDQIFYIVETHGFDYNKNCNKIIKKINNTLNTDPNLVALSFSKRGNEPLFKDPCKPKNFKYKLD